MSKVVKGRLNLLDGIEFSTRDRSVVLTGKNGTTEIKLDKHITVLSDGNSLEVKSSEKIDSGLLGTYYVLIKNAMNDLRDGVVAKLRMVGVGFRANVVGRFLLIYVGFSHDIFFAIPDGISVEVNNETEITVKGYNRHQVMLFARAIRDKKKPEPYKCKGIFLNNEEIVKKEGKRN